MSLGKVYGGDFEVLEPLSEGGMGKVFVARQRSTGKKRALKIISPELARDPRMRELFAFEACAPSMIDSDHIVDVIGAGIDAEHEQPWLAMELLEGEDLSAMIERRGALWLPEVATIVAQLCHGLGAAHAHGVVHRDLKPANVFVARARRDDVPFTVKILDFGIAAMTRSVRDPSEDSLGTPLWVAPEQLDGPREPMPSSDVWSLGLVVYALLTGRSYWRSASTGSVATLVCEVLVDELSTASARATEHGTVHHLPRGFDGWFAACVTRDPEKRFIDASIAGAAFADLLRPRAVPARWRLSHATTPCSP